MASAFIDALKLSLDGRYKISDSDLVSLSDIILRNGLGGIAEKGYLMTLVYFMDSQKLKFPISYNFMKAEWEKENLIYSFNTILSELISVNMIAIQRMKENTFFEASYINKNPNLDLAGQDYYLVITGTSQYNSLINQISNFEWFPLKELTTVKESVDLKILDPKFKYFIDYTLNTVKSKLYADLRVESYFYDDVKNEIEFNFDLEADVTYTNDEQVLRTLKKLVKNKYVLDTEGYKDDNDTIYFSIKLDSRLLKSDLTDISLNLYYVVNDLLNLGKGGVVL